MPEILAGTAVYAGGAFVAWVLTKQIMRLAERHRFTDRWQG